MRTPSISAAPPTFTAGVADAASAIAGSILWQAVDRGNFSILGGPAPRGVNYPRYLGLQLGDYRSNNTSVANTFVDFVLDTADATGRFEIESMGLGDQWRVLVRGIGGEWQAAAATTTFTHPSNGSTYRDLVTLGAAGVYQIRLEGFNNVFFGIRADATSSVKALRHPSKRYLGVGDSFADGTISDSGANYRGGVFVSLLAYLTGFDVWQASRGSTGWLAPGSYTKFADRLALDVFPHAPDGIIFAGGINDLAASSLIQAEVARVLALCKAALPNVELLTVSPFWPKGYTAYPANLLGIRDAIKTATLAAGGLFLDLLELGLPQYLESSASWAETITASVNSAATSVSVATIPAYFLTATPGVDSWYIRLGTGDTQCIRKVTNITGTGPYTLGLASATGFAFAAGSLVVMGSPGYITGTGRQGATVGDGNADRFTGGDQTHPTMAGHANIARVLAERWSRAIAIR